MRVDSGVSLTELRVDGGATRNGSLLQFQADKLQIPVIRSKTSETTALGAAYLAGLAVGFWKDKEQLTEHWQADRKFEPQMSVNDAKNLTANWHEAVQRSLNLVK